MNPTPQDPNTPKFDTTTGQPTDYGKSLGLSSPNATIVNNTPVNNTPDASTLTGVTPAVIPPTPTGTSQAANQAIGASQGALLGLQNQNLQAQQNAYDQQKTQTTDLINTYLGKGQEQLQMEQNAGVPQLQALSNSLNNQYLTQGAAYNAQYNDILNNKNLTREQSTQAISDLQQQHGYDLTNTAIQASIASTNYTNAENIINHQIDLKYQPIQDSINFGMQFLQQNKDLLTQSEQQQFQSQLQVQNQTYTQGVYNDHLIKDTQVQMIKDAAAQGASQDILNQMGQTMTSGGTIGDVAAASGGFLQQGSYAPVQTGFDPNTGVPIYSGFNQKTGQMEVKNGGNVLGQTGTDQTTVTGADGTKYQMGASTTMGAYASATSTQVNNISASVAKINSTVGNITDPKSAQAAINAVAPNSPITGAMVMASAQKYGVDPATLIGVMQAETQCGTDGSKGAQQNNFGNVGNTDFKMQTGQSVPMKSPQAGIDAVAQQLSQRKVTEGQNDPAQPQSNQSLAPNQVIAQTIKNAPALLQPAMGGSVSTGAAYFDMSKLSNLPDGMKIQAQNYAAQHGIPMLNSDQVATVNGIDEAIRNITDVVAPAWNTVSGTNRLAQAGNNFAYNSFSALFDTPYYQARNTFSSNRENLAQQIKALSGSTPKIGLLNTAENALPNPNSDTTSDGISKMQKTLDLLSQGLRTYLPNAQPVTLPTPSTAQPYTLNGVIYKQGADGNYYPSQ